MYDDVMQPGMVFTIEPMLTLGTYEWEMWGDDWTVVTKDRSLTAQFEHTIVVTERGADTLTLTLP
jgi:methionyl aminopeptidase